MTSPNNISAAAVVSQQLTTQLNRDGAQILTKAKAQFDSLSSVQCEGKGPLAAGSQDPLSNPLAHVAPAQGHVGGFGASQTNLNVIQIVALMMAVYEKSQTQAAGGMMQVNCNLESQLGSQLNNLLTSAEETQSIQQVIEQEQSREHILHYAMQAVMAVLATSIGFMIGGPVGAAVALTVCVFNDVMEDTGGWNDLCGAIDKAVGASGKTADAINFAVKIATSLLVGIASGGVAGIGMAAEDAISSTLAQSGEELTAKGAVRVIGSAVSSAFSSIASALTGSAVNETVEEGGAQLLKGAAKDGVEDLASDGEGALEGSGSSATSSVLDSATASMEDAEEGLNAISEGDDLVERGGKQVDDVRKRKGHKAVEEDIKGDPSAGGKAKPKLGKRAAIMALHTSIQTGVSFKTTDGSNGQEMGAVGDLVLACGGPDWAAELADGLADIGAMVADLGASFKVASDVPTVGMQAMSKMMRGLTLLGSASEAVLSGVSGYQQVKIGGELNKLAPVTAETIEEAGEVQTTMNAQRQNDQSLSGLMTTTEEWAGTVEDMLQSAFAPLDIAFQG